jgi:hypothetical protein
MQYAREEAARFRAYQLPTGHTLVNLNQPFNTISLTDHVQTGIRLPLVRYKAYACHRKGEKSIPQITQISQTIECGHGR